jgi:GDPmannose 4,6-dehydratase
MISGKKAIITGITGQDGAYLAEFLLKKGYQVVGIVRRSSLTDKMRIDSLREKIPESTSNLVLEYGDLCDGSSIQRLIYKVMPDEIYNLAAQSHVRISFDQPEYTVDVAALGVLRLLEACRSYVESTGNRVAFYQASSSEMFGNAPSPQCEATPFEPRSPYAVGKVAGFWLIRNYREAYGLHCSNGILFNHESELRAKNFVTRKITHSAARIKLGLQDKLYLGNLDAKRDWGSARDYVRAMWLMLQQPTPDDYVIATGRTHSVREFAKAAFDLLELDWKKFVDFDEYYLRPTEVDELCGDYSKAQRVLGWEPEVTFEELVESMVRYDLDLAEREAHASTFLR